MCEISCPGMVGGPVHPFEGVVDEALFSHPGLGDFTIPLWLI